MISVVLVASVGVLPAQASSTTSSPGAPTAVSASQDGAGPNVEATWTPATTGDPATGAVVELVQVTPSATTYVAAVTCYAGCQSAIFRYLTFGDTYEVAVWPQDASQNTGAPAVSATTTLQDSCASGACVTVDATDPIGPANHNAQGFVDSVYPTGSDSSELSQLNTTMWRGQPEVMANKTINWSSWDAAAAAGVPNTLILSSMWSSATGPATPWSNWSYYSAWVTSTVNAIVASGHQVDYWEPYNEPGQPGYYSSANFATVTPARLLEQFKVTYEAIKSVLPDAQIIGPSLAVWSDTPQAASAGFRGFDMVTFLNYAAANDLQLAALSWHFIADYLGAYPSENYMSPQIVVDEVQEARRLIAARPALGDPEIFVNEYEAPEVEGIPGWDVAYLSALTTAQVNSASLSCWAYSCAVPELDGLLNIDGLLTMPDYWVRAAYGAMSGQMLTTTSTDDTVSALASYNASDSQVSVLVGRGSGCHQNAWCAAVWPRAVLASPEPVTVQITVPWSGGSVNVSAQQIPGDLLSSLLSLSLPSVSTLSVTPTGNGDGTVSVTIPSFDDGDAYSLLVTPSS
jgi:hypothetical protein